MPRKIDPHRFEQKVDGPTDYIDAFEVPDSVQDLLPADLPDAQRLGALSRIRDALGEYKWETDAGPHRYSRAEAAKGLKDLLAAGDFSRQAIISLNQRAYDTLYFLIPGPAEKRWVLSFDDSAPPVDAIRSGVRRSLEMLNASKGPEKSVPLAYLVMRLCHVCEELTGKSVAHHTKTKDLAYSQDAQTAAGKFVTNVIQAAFEDVPSTAINRHLRAFVKHRPGPF